MNINIAYSIQSPLFIRAGKEAFTMLVIAEDLEGNAHTHQHDFDTKEAADVFADRVLDHGAINTEFWHEGTPWDRYLIPQSWEEEKAEALWNEAFA